MTSDHPDFALHGARMAGATCAVAIPVFSGDLLGAVSVLVFGDCDATESTGGAIELWHRSDERGGRSKLSLLDGCYGAFREFEHVSRWATFRRGVGLPGLVWATGMPILMEDIGSGARFLRSVEADHSGITTGLGLPVGCDPGEPVVLTLLSTSTTPIARVVEIWTTDRSGEPELQIGHRPSRGDAVRDDSGRPPRPSDMVRSALSTGLPAVTSVVTGERPSPPGTASKSRSRSARTTAAEPW